MSHISVLKASIRNPVPEIVSVAFDYLRRKYGAEKTTIVRDFFGREVEVFEGLSIGGRTLGVRLSDGKLEFLADEFVWGEEMERIIQDFERYYTATAVLCALQGKRYDVVVEEIGNTIIIDAYR